MLFLFSCGKDEGKKCGEGEMVFNNKQCVPDNPEILNYSGVIDFYCLSDSFLIQHGDFTYTSFLYFGSGGVGAQSDDNGHLYYFVECDPIHLESTAIVVEEEKILSNPDKIEAKVYQVTGPAPTAERMDSTTVTLRKR